MNIYLVERTDDVGYDEYDAFVVSAKDENEALVTIGGNQFFKGNTEFKVVGTTTSKVSEIILGSFNAG